MTAPHIPHLVALLSLVAAAAACGPSVVVEGREEVRSGEPAEVLPLNGGGDVCGGCFRGNECVPGSDLDACGANGDKCAACSLGETCVHASCEAIPSTCIAKLEETEALMGPCSADAECDADEWCQASCCDPVSHLCFAVGACRKKLATGEDCSYNGGDHECISGVCDPITDLCQ